MAEQFVVVDVKEDTKIRRGCCRQAVLRKGKQIVSKEEAEKLVNSGAASFLLGSGYGTTNSGSELYTPITAQCGYWHPIRWGYQGGTGIPQQTVPYKDDRDAANGYTVPIMWDWRARDCNTPASQLPIGHNGTCGRWEAVDGNGLAGYWVHATRGCENGYWYTHPTFGMVWISVPVDGRSDTNCGTMVTPRPSGFPRFQHPRINIGNTWMPFPCAELLK